jgi:1-acyl-sn-glycerol-3-phosphate acyltransferase
MNTSTSTTHAPPDPPMPPATDAPGPRASAVGGQGSAAPRGYTYRGEGSWWVQGFLWKIGRVFFQFIAVLMFHIRTFNRWNIPSTGGALLVTNHQSFLDPWLIGIAIKRQIHYMARDSLFQGGLTQWMMESTNTFPIRRGRADSTAVREAIARLNKGYLVNIFPEATRSADGTIGPIAAGVAIIVHRSKAPVIPIVIDGAFEAWPRNQKFPSCKPVRILYGEPIGHAELAGLSADEIAVRIREEMVKLQTRLNSPHAAESRQRMQTDLQAGKRRLVVGNELAG